MIVFQDPSLIFTNNVKLLLLEQYAAQFRFTLGIADHIVVALMGKTRIWCCSSTGEYVLSLRASHHEGFCSPHWEQERTGIKGSWDPNRHILSRLMSSVLSVCMGASGRFS